MHVTLVPLIASAGEVKTKPTQHSVKELRSIGIQPDILVCRSERPLARHIKEKISEFCDVPVECVITTQDASSIYEVPLIVEQEGLAHQVLDIFAMEQRPPDLSQWQAIVNGLTATERRVEIAIVGKYVSLNDAYKSVAEALQHAAIATKATLKLRWVNSEDLEADQVETYLSGVQGVVVPGGFGTRGIAGKLRAIQYVREQRIPFWACA
jgi:CTP synthase